MNVTVELIQSSEQVSLHMTAKGRLTVNVPDLNWKWIPGCRCCNSKWAIREACPCDHITPVLSELHWLPIRECVKFKVACLVHQSLFGQAPLYLADDCCLVSDSTRRSAVSWLSDLRGAANTQQLRRQNFCGRWTSLVELSSGPAAQSRHCCVTCAIVDLAVFYFGHYK